MSLLLEDTAQAGICADCGDPVECEGMLESPPPHYCEDCYSNYTWCNVCQADQYTGDSGSHCRHIFWTENGWMGCGGEYPYHDHAKSLYHVFCKINGRCWVTGPGRETKRGWVWDGRWEDNIDLMEMALEARCFYLSFWGSLLGPTNIDCEVGVRGRRADIGQWFLAHRKWEAYSYWPRQEWRFPHQCRRDRVRPVWANQYDYHDDLSDEEEERMSEGVQWLNSLQPMYDPTTDVNKADRPYFPGTVAAMDWTITQIRQWRAIHRALPALVEGGAP